MKGVLDEPKDEEERKRGVEVSGEEKYAEHCIRKRGRRRRRW